MLAAAIEFYAVAGLIVAVAFVSFGVQRVDAAARGAGIGFRVLILPGAIALWPVLLRKWVHS
jgi:hypothetical protein